MSLSRMCCVLFCLAALSRLHAQDSTVTITSGSGTAGSTFTTPVVLRLGNNFNLDSITIGITVSANGSAPPVGLLTFAPDPVLANAGSLKDNSTPGQISLAYFNISPLLSGSVRLGLLGLTIPTQAQPNQTYQLRVTGSSGTNGSANVIILPGPDGTLTVPGTGSGGITLSPTSLQFSAQQGGTNPPSQPVTLTNSGGLNWSATTSGNFFQVSPASGSGNATLNVSVTSTGLVSGLYSGSFQVSALGVAPQSVTVTLTVSGSGPAIALSPQSLTFSAQQGGGNPQNQVIAISNAGGGTLSWTAAVGSVAWLALSPTAGSGNGTVTVTANVAGLSAGTYNGTILFTASGAGNSPQSVPVTLNIAAPSGSIALSSQSLSFSGKVGGTSPASQGVVVTCGNLTWNAAVTSGSWLSVSPASGASGATLTVSASLAGLAAGTYNGMVQVSATGATNTPQTLSVTLTVAAATSAVISFDQTSLQFVATSGGSGPPSQTFQVLNAGTGSLGWTATVSTQSGGPWIALSPSAGVSPTTVTVSVATASLFRGIYQGTITITATASSAAVNSPQTMPVTLAIDAPVVSKNGIVNGASFSQDATVSPGSIASLFGVNLSLTTQAAESLPLPTSLGGAQVLVGGKAAPLFYVSPSQINFQMPTDVAGATASVVVSSAGLTGIGANVKMQAEAPGIFTASSGGAGQGAVLNSDNSPNSAANPAATGSVVQIFATGLGVTSPPAVTGQPGAPVEPLNRTAAMPVVKIGGVPSDILYSGLAPGYIGLYQVNARVPLGSTGNVPVQIQINGQLSNAATIAVK